MPSQVCKTSGKIRNLPEISFLHQLAMYELEQSMRKGIKLWRGGPICIKVTSCQIKNVKSGVKLKGR